MTKISILIISLFITFVAHEHAMIIKKVEEDRKDREQYKIVMKEISRRLK